MPAFQGGFKESEGGVGALVSLNELNRRRCLGANEVAAITIICYIILGLMVYVFNQGMDPLDSVYLSVVTLLTIGYGDIPITDRPFQSFYMLFGAGMCLAFFAILTGNIMEKEEVYARKRLARVTSAINRLLFAEEEKSTDNPLHSGVALSSLNNSKEGADVTVEDTHNVSLNTVEDELHELKHSALVHVMHILVAILVGAAIIGTIESWNYTDSLYWSITTMSSVGYGDIFPKTQTGKIFVLFFAPLACAIAMKGFSDLVRYPMLLREKINEAKVMEQFKLGLSERVLTSILSDRTLRSVPHLQKSSHGLEKSEFVLMLLLMMDKVSIHDLMLTSSIFQKLDIMHEGKLSFDVLKEELQKARHREEEEREAAMRLETSGLGSMSKGFESMLLGAGDGIGKLNSIGQGLIGTGIGGLSAIVNAAGGGQPLRGSESSHRGSVKKDENYSPLHSDTHA